MYKSFGKRVFDLCFSIIGFVLLLPVFLLVIILLYIFNKGQVFFFQKRPGKNNKLFKVVKFKTMNDRKDYRGNLLPDEDRLTTIGKFVRKTSLDEIPQLINVIRGDMSLVGPRPLLVEYLPLYNRSEARRHEAMPGITGWAQVNGRNAISWAQKFELDVWYVDNISFKIDCKILWITVVKVFKREGVTSDNSVTMEKFTGTI